MDIICRQNSYHYFINVYDRHSCAWCWKMWTYRKNSRAWGKGKKIVNKIYWHVRINITTRKTKQCKEKKIRGVLYRLSGWKGSSERMTYQNWPEASHAKVWRKCSRQMVDKSPSFQAALCLAYLKSRKKITLVE